jgi:hypothetical protein
VLILFMNTVRSALDVLLKREEERYTGKPDAHLMAVQKATLAMIKRDMVQMARPTAWLLGAALGVLCVGNLLLATVMVVHIASFTDRAAQSAPAPRATSVMEARP